MKCQDAVWDPPPEPDLLQNQDPSQDSNYSQDLPQNPIQDPVRNQDPKQDLHPKQDPVKDLVPIQDPTGSWRTLQDLGQDFHQGFQTSNQRVIGITPVRTTVSLPHPKTITSLHFIFTLYSLNSWDSSLNRLLAISSCCLVTRSRNTVSSPSRPRIKFSKRNQRSTMRSD